MALDTNLFKMKDCDKDMGGNRLEKLTQYKFKLSGMFLKYTFITCTNQNPISSQRAASSRP